MEQVAPLMDGGLFVLISSYLKKFPENCFVGIRIPWTLASEKAWNRTHREGRWVLIMAGALATASAFSPDAMNLLIVVVGKIAIIPLLYSPWHIFARKNRKPLPCPSWCPQTGRHLPS